VTGKPPEMASRATSHEPPDAACLFCSQTGGTIVWKDEFARVVLAGDADHPGFCRVILNGHVKEMTDLDTSARDRLMRIVYAVERALRDLLEPDKINLASLGNLVPHLHWHVIPRHRDDPHYPNPVWGARTGTQPRALTSNFEPELARRLKDSLA
jgi:diadenosine tetraphosphate (Ap4A) HIT family hydrolase